MHKDRRQARKRRVMWIGLALAVTIVCTALVFYTPRGLRGPETVARNYIDALLQTPDDAVRVRAAAHIGEADDLQALIEGLSTRNALDFLRTRRRQGATHDIRPVEARQSDAQRYVSVLHVVETADGRASLIRRFEVSLQKTDDGDWRVASVTVSE